jgi:hypothetical protein
MRKIIQPIIVLMLAMTLVFVANSAPAQKRWKIIEMGESSQQVKFLMSEEECAAEDAEKARLEEIRAARKKEASNIRLLSLEMCESGQNISFPMSAVEIQKAKLIEADQLKEMRTVEQEVKVAHEGVELCECGEIIIFHKSP